MSLIHIFSTTLSTLTSYLSHTNSSSSSHSIPVIPNFLHQTKIASKMATAISPVTAVAAVVGPSRPSVGRTRVRYINGLNSFGGLKAHNHVASLGLSVTSDQSFAKIVSSLKQQGRKSGGGALTSTCSNVAEIFRIAAIMNGITLVGVAIGFVLLRIEAIVEEE
ncbi:uncharacterized protein LOC121791217 [Salvia splendens]|nr:uncharacterized protein LOC121791217 [Salvia splendens]